MTWQRDANRPPLEAATIFMQAERFHSACITLQRYDGPGADNHPLPIILLELTAAELYLKTIHFIENGEIVRGHNLKNLFRRLSSKARREIARTWEEWFASSPYSKLPEDMRKSLPTPLTLENVLGAAANIYEQSRYVWEDRPSSFALSGVANHIRDYIVLKHAADVRLNS